MTAKGILTIALAGLTMLALTAGAQDSSKPKLKNEVSKLNHGRKTDHSTKQVTIDPKKSPGKHAKSLSKNVNHELNRESKDLNHVFQRKNKKKS